MTFKEKIKLHPLIVSFVGIILGVAINYLFSLLATTTGVWLYLDNIGTALVAATCGPLPGIIVGIINNCLNSINDSVSIFYCVISALAAVAIWFFVRRGYLRKWYNCFLLLLILVFICGFCGSILTWFLYGGGIGNGISSTMANYFYAQNGNAFWSQMAADLIIDVWDKAIVVAILYLFITFVPSSFSSYLPLGHYLSKDFSLKEEKKNRIKTRKSTIRFKFILGFLVLSLVMIGTIAITTYSIVSSNTNKTYQGIGVSGSRTVSNIVNGDLVDSFLNNENEAEYQKEKATLQGYFSTNEKIEYLYVYKIEEEHLVVVFDLDTPTVQGGEKGEFISWDPAFEQYKAALLNGEEIPTIIVNDDYGYLLSSYTPIKNSQGVTVAYGCVDISMETVAADLRTATTKTTSILLVISVLFISLAFELTERVVLKPIEQITDQVQTFQKVGISKWLDSEEKKNLQMVLTGDEFQTLDAHLISSENYISKAYKENEDKNKEIIVMQRNMVYALSEIVESRDANTGDHIRRTAFYVRLIAQELKERNIFPNIVTTSFIKKLTFAAPLHDVGKIAISDTILNKPGKLTKEEFDIMKTHVTAGTKIIKRAMEGTKADSYLDVAKEIAEYHHERWDGTGYMKGLKGDEIPLSARIMAVSDVFDALVSKRSYKEPFSYEEAIKIIKEESGTHFDPRVVDAFLSDEVQLQIIEFLKN